MTDFDASAPLPGAFGADLSPSKSDISDLGQLMVPNSGKPEFGWGEVDRGCRKHQLTSPLWGPQWGEVASEASG